MKKDRVIAEIDSLEKARRVEETVKTGYAEVTQEEITQWMAVEEDLASSYGKMEAAAAEKGKKDLLGSLRRESESNLKELGEILERLKSLDSQRRRRIEEIGRQS